MMGALKMSRSLTLTEAKVELRERIKNDNFSLVGLKVPVTPRKTYY